MQVGGHRYVYFRIAGSDGSPVTGLTKASFTIVFTRNNAVCNDLLQITDLGNGLYSADYTPGVAGTDYLDIYEPTSKIRSTFTEEIQNANEVVVLTSDYNSSLKPDPSIGPSSYVLYLFLASDWIAGNRSPDYAKGQTYLNPNGTWQTPIYAVHNTYTVALINKSSSLVLANTLVI